MHSGCAAPNFQGVEAELCDPLNLPDELRLKHLRLKHQETARNAKQRSPLPRNELSRRYLNRRKKLWKIKNGSDYCLPLLLVPLHVVHAVSSLSAWHLLVCIWFPLIYTLIITIPPGIQALWRRLKSTYIIRRARITWVKAGAVRRWHRFPRRQQLRADEFVQGEVDSWMESWLCRSEQMYWTVSSLLLGSFSAPYFFVSIIDPWRSNDLTGWVRLAWNLNCSGWLVWLAVSVMTRRLAAKKHGKMRIVVSHSWLAAEHPDPSGLQLRELVAELDRLHVPDDALIFYDFCCLPQWDKEHPDFKQYGFKLRDDHPARRTPTEEKEFSEVLGVMHRLYTWTEAFVLVLPHVPETATNNRPYEERGWTCFEIAISSLYSEIVNLGNNELLQVLEILELPKRSVGDFEAEFSSKVFTQRGDKGRVSRMYKELHDEYVESRFLPAFQEFVRPSGSHLETSVGYDDFTTSLQYRQIYHSSYVAHGRS